MFVLKMFGKVGIASAIAAMVLNAYDLFVIEEEETPLASGPVSSNFYLLTLIAAVVLLCVVLVVAWVLIRKRYSARYIELRNKQGESKVKVPLSIAKIKELISVTEVEIASKLVKSDR